MTAAATGWYTLTGFHDNQSGAGNYAINASDNGAPAVAMNSTNFDLVTSTTDLTNAGISLSAEHLVTSATTIAIPNSSSGSSGTSSTATTSDNGGYYTEMANATVTLDANDIGVLKTNGSTMVVTATDGTNLTLHWNGTTLVDALGVTHSYNNTTGVLTLPIGSSTPASTIEVSATVIDNHGVASLATTTTEIYSGSNSLTELTGGDTFRFELTANGAANTPNTDTISAFNPNTAANGGDVLNLADLLQGATSGNIANYLHFTTSTSGNITTTTVHVSETGGYSTGYSSTQDTLQIALNNVDLVHSAGATLSDAAIIQSLLNKGKLVE